MLPNIIISLKKFVMKKTILLMLPIIFFGIAAFTTLNQKIITGKITDETGNPVSFASVNIKGAKMGASADANGEYKLSAPESATTLIFVAAGFIQQEVNINTRTIINVVLKKSAKELNEVVVVSAYGSKRKSASVGCASSVLAGKVSGVQIGISSNSTPTYFYNNDNDEESNTEAYSNIVENGFKNVTDHPVSTFSIDVDAASYSNVRRFLNQGQLPPAGAVRTEEMINYFKYQYPQPSNSNPFSFNTEMSDCPWNKQHRLLLVGLQGKTMPTENLPASNLVFLIDVSGSMAEENKLPLVKTSLKLLTDQLREKDKISIVVYAGNAGLVLPTTSGSEKDKIKKAIDALESGGSTAGGAGIQLAYKTAQENFVKDGNNRVILCTDGDFNVGVSSDDDMVRLVEKEKNNGVFLTALGYGMGNYKDSKMQQMADKGNGNNFYIDNISEAKKVLVNEFGGTLFTIAKDVKLQLEFNPAKVAGYRLIGYENRLLNKEDFNNDKKDAGELGSGHTVTALYEIIPAGAESDFLEEAEPLKYEATNDKEMGNTKFSNELLTIKFRYKAPSKDKSELINYTVKDDNIAFAKTSDNFRFAAAVANFAMLLRNSEYKGNSSYTKVLNMANAAIGADVEGYRKECIELIKTAETITNSKAVVK
jgi:Ca-activated chloride channel homolog